MQGTERAKKAQEVLASTSGALTNEKPKDKKREQTELQAEEYTLRLCSASSSRIDTGPYHPRPDFMMAAHEIARDHFDYESGNANIAALKDQPIL